MTFDADLTACAELVQRGDPDRFRAVMAAPVAARLKLFPIFAFNVEVSRAPWVTEEPMIAEMRLQWWRDALEEIAEGGEVRRHEVVSPLSGVLSSQAASVLDALVEARRWDIHRDPFADADAFAAYLDATTGGLLEVAALSLGPAEPEVLRDLGWAAGLAAFLRAIPELEARGRVPLVDGRPEAVAALAAEGLNRLKRARSRRREVSSEASPALLTAWETGPVLRLAAADPSKVASGALQRSEAVRRLGLTFRAMTGRW